MGQMNISIVTCIGDGKCFEDEVIEKMTTILLPLKMTTSSYKQQSKKKLKEETKITNKPKKNKFIKAKLEECY
jgi:hypothetical protein